MGATDWRSSPARQPTGCPPSKTRDRFAPARPLLVITEASDVPSAAHQRLLPFTGLIPGLLMVPVLAFNLYALAMASGTLVIAYQLRRGQGVANHRPEFLAVNRASTALWAVGFAVGDAMALLLGQPLRLYLPIATMVALAVVSRPLSRAHLSTLLGVRTSTLPAESTEPTTTTVLGG